MAARRLRCGAITWCRSQRPKNREHYAVKQVNPVAEPELAAPGLRFGRVIGDDRDMERPALKERRSRAAGGEPRATVSVKVAP